MGESIEADSILNHCLLETELIINAQPVFYCIDSVTICNRVGIQYLLNKLGPTARILGKKKLIQNE
ncbi:hypothetical protein A9Q75_03460 [Colwellia psychrerythraea]|uniref:Uncharacterized protein n=1 Tax=Colwellia psychrerythraea TaxID=28229 RepID=A0A1Y5EN95_COLPS|nr:hypothetical protein A9Q75_03460 [Colwellia psychrerythraea]